MAQFSEVLAKKTLDAIKGTASGLVEGTKGALVSQVPGFALSAAKFFNDVKKEVEESNKKEEEEQKKQTEEQKKQTEEQKKQSQYLGDSNKWLDQLAKDTRIMRDKLARDDKFAEEVNNEKKLLDEKMLSTLEDIRDSLTGQGVAGERTKKVAEEGAGTGILGGLAGTAATSILGGAAGGAGAAAAGGVMARYILPAMRAIIPKILPLLFTAIRFAGPIGLVAGTGLALANAFTDKEGRPRAGSSGGVKTQGEFLDKAKKYFGGSEEVVTELNQGRVDKYIADVSKKETGGVKDPDKEVNSKSGTYAMGKIQLLPSVVTDLSANAPGLDKSFANMPDKVYKKDAQGKEVLDKDGKKILDEEKTKQARIAIAEKWKALPTEEKQKFYTAYIKQNYESLKSVIGRAPTESELYAAQFGVGDISSAIKTPDAALKQTQLAAMAANPRALGVPTALDKNMAKRMEAIEKKKEAEKTADTLRKENSVLYSQVIPALEKKLEENKKEYAKAEVEYNKDLPLTPEGRVDTAKVEARLDQLNKLREEKTRLEGEIEQKKQLRRQNQNEIDKNVIIAQMTPEQIMNLQASAPYETEAERQKASRNEILTEGKRLAEKIRAENPEIDYDVLPRTTLVGIGRVPPSAPSIEPKDASYPAVANTSQTQTAFQTTPMMPPWAGAPAPGLLPISGNLDVQRLLDVGQAQLYTPPPAGSGTNTQKFEAKSIVELMLESLKKIEQNTSKLEKGQAEANKNAEKDRKKQQSGGSGAAQAKVSTTKRDLSEQERRQKYFDDRFQGLIKTTENITKNLINSELNNLFFGPRGQTLGVSRDQGKQLGFLSGIAGRELRLAQKSTDVLSKLFGEKIGRAYGGVTGEALGLGIEKFALSAGDQLGFGGVKKGGIFGNYQTFNIGQILGNFAGNKKERKLAREQLIYNLTGIPTGATTIFSEVDRFFPGLGLKPDPNTGKVSFETLANAGGKLVSQGLNSLFGFSPKGGAPGAAPATVTKISTETGKPYQALAEPGDTPTAAPQQGIFGGFFDRLFGRGPSGTAVPNAPRPITVREQNAFLEANNELPQQLETTNETLADQSTKKDDQGFFGGMMDSIAGLGNSIMRIFTGAGGGTGGMGGGGGFGGGGGAQGGGFFENIFGNIANLGMNLLGMYAGAKITKAIFKTKNPYTQAIGGIIVNEGLKYLVKTGAEVAAPVVSEAATSLFGPAAGGAVLKFMTGGKAPVTTAVPVEYRDLSGVADLTGGGAYTPPIDGSIPGAGIGDVGDVATAVTDFVGDGFAGSIEAADQVYQGAAATPTSDVLGGMDLSTVGTVLNVLTIGYKLSQGQYGSAVGQAIGSYFGPIGAFIGSMLGGALDDTFGKTPHRTGYSLTKGAGFDRSFGADDKNRNENYQKATDTIAKSAQTILNSYAQKVGSTSKFDVAVAIGSDNNDPSFSIYKIFKDGTVIYDSGQEWGLTSYFPDAVKEFVAKRMNGPLVDAMKSLNLTEAQRSDLNRITDYTQTSQIADFVNKGATDASLLDATYGSAFAENAGYDQVDMYHSGGEGGESVTATTPMVYSLKDKAFVPIKETVTATRTTQDDVSTYTSEYQTPDTSVLGYDENGNPIRAADLNRKVGTATAANTVVDTATGATSMVGYATGSAAAAAAAANNVSDSTNSLPGTALGIFTGRRFTGGTATVAGSGTPPVTDYYNQTQQSFNDMADNVATVGVGGNNTAVIAPTNVVDNSINTNTTVINTDTRNSDPVLFKGSRRIAFVD